MVLPFFAFFEPMPATQTKIVVGANGHCGIGSRYTRDATHHSGYFLRNFNDKYGVEVSMISCVVSMLYSSFTTTAKLKERMTMLLSKVQRQAHVQQPQERERHLHRRRQTPQQKQPHQQHQVQNQHQLGDGGRLSAATDRCYCFS